MGDLIRYRARPSDEQIANLRAFTLRGERSDPVVFAGRDDILSPIRSTLQVKRIDPNFNSITQIVQGAPGAGKTSLLNELDRTSRGDHVSVVRLDGEDLSESVRVAERFLGSVGEDTAEVGAASTRTRRTTGDIKLAQHQEGRETRRASALERMSEGASVWDALAPLLEVEDDHVFLLLIDEAQHVTRTEGKDINEVVTSLHSGGYATAGLRILPVFAGLSDTADRLLDVGLSRLATSPHHLGVLTLEETQFAAAGFLHDPNMGLHVVFDRNDRAKLARTFAVASEGWPRHLHHYLTGLAKALVDDCDRSNPNGVASLDAILLFGHEKRCDYYDGRLQSANLGSVEGALMALTEKSRSSVTVDGDTIVDYMAERLDVDSNSVREKISHAVHAGVLERRADLGRSIYAYPIPSFSTFMACHGEREPTLASMRWALEERMNVLSQEARDKGHELDR